MELLRKMTHRATMTMSPQVNHQEKGSRNVL